MADKEIVYEVKIDNNNFNSSLNKMESAVRFSVKKVSVTVKKKSKQAAETVKKEAGGAQSTVEYSVQRTEITSKNSSQNVKNSIASNAKASSAIKESSKDAEKAIGESADSASESSKISFSKIGEVAGKTVDIVGKIISPAAELEGAMSQFAGAAGTSKDELDGYEEVLTSIYTNNYGNSFEDIAGAMATIKQQMGELNQTDLQNLTESAFALKDTFGYDINESVRAASSLISEFGISGDEAVNLIAAGAEWP